ncbi:MAG: hypothetical protein IJ092_04310 [Atopobiaceae bacterium]|nr:hypothetical protein [Atopobiaceae bacterium]
MHQITVLVGHAGTGKTNVALNLALAEAAAGRHVTLADLDVVNPYFRSSDYPQLLADAGVRLIAPVLARTTLDTPSLSGELDVAIQQAAADPDARLIIDVGGDDDGATTIGRWSGKLNAADAHVLYVVSAYRALTQAPEDAAAMLPDIEEHAHLRADAVLNTSNLGDETTLDHVRHGRAFASEVARLCGLPLEATVVPKVALSDVSEPLQCDEPEAEPLLVMPRLVRTPWDN